MLSVIVITKDEEKMIETCLDSVKWADEIIVADNGSTDDTIKLAKKYTDKVFIYQDNNFASLRNKAFEKAQGEWVLYVDADERVSGSLKEEIQSIVQNTTYSAVALSRRNVIFGQSVRYGPFWPDWVIRLLKRSDFKGWVGEVHEQPAFDGGLGYSKFSLFHLTHRGAEQMIMKNLVYSKIDARLRFQSGHPQMVGWRFLRILFSELFYQGIVRRGFFSGTIGVMDSVIQVFSLFTTYVRLWELQQGKEMEKIYCEFDEKLKKSDFKN